MGESHAFWLDLLRDVFGMADASSKCLFEQRTFVGGRIDVSIPDAKTIVEQKSSGVDLDHAELRQGVRVTPFEQAKRYADSLPNQERPDWIVVCNFETFRIHSLNRVNPAQEYTEFTLAELPEQLHLLDFLVDPAHSRSERQRLVSMQAGELIGALYDGLHRQYLNPDSPEDQHALNMLCVRLVFCLFAEDAGLFRRDSFVSYLSQFPANQMRRALLDLFDVLAQPVEARDPYLEDSLASFPYVNGGLFAQRAEIPHFTEELRTLLLEHVAANTDWSQISPTIFGGVFESTLNPETRRAGGMHYTSPENIHRVIGPLFLDGLTRELNELLENKTLGERKCINALRAFQDKLASLKFFDPACGSGNFLTETFLSLRRLEDRVLSELGDQISIDFEEVGGSPIKVSLKQFYGIEINDFAAEVARTALWIAELQANIASEQIVLRSLEDLPLRDSARIVVGNALRTDWSLVLPAAECDYVMGNPPFIGYSNLTAGQKADRAALFAETSGGGDSWITSPAGTRRQRTTSRRLTAKRAAVRRAGHVNSRPAVRSYPRTRSARASR
ncbi:DNA methyltransferase [Dermabacteraceae bacterium P7006]